MLGDGLRVQVVRFLQFWTNWVMAVVWSCYAFVFGTPADSEGKVENRPHCITSDGGASPSDATSSGEGWEEITIALTAKLSAPQELEISNNIDPAGEFKVPLAYADEASQATDAAATGASAQCQTPSPRRSLEDSNIITAQRTPELAVQDVKIGEEVLVVNTCFVKSLNQEHECIGAGVDALYDDRFRKFGKARLDNAPAGALPVEAKVFKGPGHVPRSVSEGSVPTFSMHVDKTKTTLVPSLETRRIAAGEGAEVLVNLEGFSDSLGQGSSSSSFM